MKARPEVSVVVGVRDGAQHLAASLESVLCQEGVELELIVVDDGSTDETARILEELAAADPRIRPFRTEPKGLTAALLFGCLQARAPFLARQDVGDLSRPGRLKAQVDILRREPSVVLVSGRTDRYGPLGEWLGTERGSGLEDRPVELFARWPRLRVVAGPTSHGSAMFRREAYEAVGGYRAAFYLGQDWDLWQRLGLRGLYYQIGASIYSRRLFLESLSGQFRRFQRRFGRLSLASARCLATGKSDEAILRRAERLSERVRRIATSPSNAEGRADMAYFLAAMLSEQSPTAARRYLEEAIALRPLRIKPRLRRWLLRAGEEKG
jgi:glycosyltransferase involved in cell wall biosynthesis